MLLQSSGVMLLVYIFNTHVAGWKSIHNAGVYALVVHVGHLVALVVLAHLVVWYVGCGAAAPDQQKHDDQHDDEDGDAHPEADDEQELPQRDH